MTRYERDIMTDNNIAPDLMEQIGKYLKQKRRASTLPRKQTNVMSKELLDDIMSFVDENPNATRRWMISLMILAHLRNMRINFMKTNLIMK